MTQIDEKAIYVAVESLRPLFREPVTYLEQAARDSIAAYLAALLPPAGDQQICDRLAQIRREHAEAERERDEARERADILSDLLNTTQLCAEKITARAERAEARLAEAERYAEGLAVALAARHYPEVNVWRPLSGDLIGLLTQIDNMTTGLSRTARAERLEAALREAQEAAATQNGGVLSACKKTAALRAEMERIADLTERWTDSLVSQVNEIARAALSPAPAGGADGWALVPREPTRAMLNAAIDVDSFKLGNISPLGFRESPQRLFERCYRAMIAAAPAKGARDA